jgi:hypothetical protein
MVKLNNTTTIPANHLGQICYGPQFPFYTSYKLLKL